MAKLLGPDFMSLQVRNLSISRTFYTELLGLTVDERFDTPDFVLFDTNSIPFALTAARVNLDEAPQPGWGVTFWIDCDQVNIGNRVRKRDGAIGAVTHRGFTQRGPHFSFLLERGRVVHLRPCLRTYAQNVLVMPAMQW